jgi:hypothetical protein
MLQFQQSINTGRLGGYSVKLTLAKHGGLAAGIRRSPEVLDSNDLPQAAAAELARLVAELKATRSVQNETPGRARDAMSYSITVEEGGEPTVLRQSDTTMSPSFAALLQWLERHRAGK